MRRLVVPALLASALAACTGGDDQDGDALPPVEPGPSCSPGAAEVPVECVAGEPSAFSTAVPTPTTPPPPSSAAIDPVSVAAQPGDLARGGNDADPSRTSAVFTVTVPAGHRIRTTGACEGRNLLKITTEPKSGAEQEFACGFEGAPAELTVEDATPARAATRYVVRVSTTPPSRWFVVVSSTDEPVNAS